MLETYTYAGVGGRASARSLQSYVAGTAGDSFTQAWAYNDAGEVTTLTSPRCTQATCNGTAPTSLTTTYTFTNGWLTAVPNYATAIAYHPNGMVASVNHQNGTTDTVGADPNGMRRPASYATTGPTTWSSGAYAYDGAGNVTAIGGSSFTYDLVSRLTSGSVSTARTGTGSLKTQSATFDPYGNLTTLTTNGCRCSTPRPRPPPTASPRRPTTPPAT